MDELRRASPANVYKLIHAKAMLSIADNLVRGVKILTDRKKLVEFESDPRNIWAKLRGEALWKQR
jgi:hypothetical protein